MKIVGEFKKFITRGNVVDLAVGMIIGASFTSIVKALADGIFKPCINFLIYKTSNGEGLDDMYTFLITKYNEDGSINLASSTYIDWGGFYSAIINFLMTALVLFLIVKAFNKFRDHKEIMLNDVKRAEKKMELNLKLTKKEIKALEEDKLDKEEKLKAEEEMKRKELESKMNEPSYLLLNEIKEILKKNQGE